MSQQHHDPIATVAEEIWRESLNLGSIAILSIAMAASVDPLGMRVLSAIMAMTAVLAWSLIVRRYVAMLVRVANERTDLAYRVGELLTDEQRKVVKEWEQEVTQ